MVTKRSSFSRPINQHALLSGPQCSHTKFEKIRLDANQEHDREIPSKTGFVPIKADRSRFEL